MKTIFIHVPKTAGTSLRKMLHAAYGFRLLEIDQSYHAESVRRLEARKCYVGLVYRALHGHITFQEAKRIFGGANFYTVLRHPQHRVFSLARYVAQRPRHFMNDGRFSHPQEVLDHFATEMQSQFFFEYPRYLLSDVTAATWQQHIEHAALEVVSNFTGILTLEEFGRLSHAEHLNVSQASRAPLTMPPKMLDAVLLEESFVSEVLNRRTADHRTQFERAVAPSAVLRIPSRWSNRCNPIRVPRRTFK